MKVFLIVILSLFCCFHLSAQQEFSFGYRVKPQLFDKVPGSGNDSLRLFVKVGENYEQRFFDNKLIAVIDKKNLDTLHVKFWPNLTLSGSKLIPQNPNISTAPSVHDSSYIIHVGNWDLHKKKYRQVIFPYRHKQLTATTIPFRIKFRDSTTYEGEFLNANVTYLWVRGITKIFESKLVKPRHHAWSFGPFLGLSEIENPENEKTEFAFNWGINGIFATGKLNLVLAIGAENGFSRATKKLNPYIGFGFGFSLAESFEPEIEVEE